MRKRNHVKNSRIGKALSMVLAIMLPLPRHRKVTFTSGRVGDPEP